MQTMNDRWVIGATGFGLLGGLLATICRSNVVDLDLFHEMALFREALAVGWLPAGDPFAYTPTVDLVVHHEWGTGAVLYLATVASGFGTAGLVVLKYLVCGLVVWGCVRCARLRGAGVVSMAILGPIGIAMGALGVTTIRAQLFTLGLLTLQLLLFEEDRKGGRWWLAVWLPVYVLWLNLHAGFVVGCGLYGLYSLERFGREFCESGSVGTAVRRTGHLIGGGLAMLPAAMINPYGWEYVPYLWHAIRMERPLVAEWQSLWQSGEFALLAWYFLSLAAVAYVLAAKGFRTMPGLAMVAVAAVLAFQHTRHLSIYGVVWFCYVPGYLQDTRLCRAVEKVRVERALHWAAFWTLCGIGGLCFATYHRFWELRIPVTRAEVEEQVPVYPAGAVDYLAENRFSGNVLLPYNAGAFVSWKLFPAVKVSVDSRYEVAYPPGAVEEIVGFFDALDGWQQTLARYPTDAVLAPRWRPIDKLLDGLEPSDGIPAFRLKYRDDAYSLYVREGVGEELPTVDREGEQIVGRYP